MPLCESQPTTWKNRRAYRLSNGAIELIILLGGGHIAEFRLSDSPVNTLWEAPWPTLDPQTFSPPKHNALYGDGPVGKFLSGYTGHALVLGNFGMPSDPEAARGVPLHGEAACSDWTVVSAEQDDHCALLVLEVDIPYYHLHFRREISLAAGASCTSIRETVRNQGAAETTFQWVQHVACGEPFLAHDESNLFVDVSRAITWPLGYEGFELLRDDAEFLWPNAPANSGGTIDLSNPFAQSGTGFVASLLTSADHPNAAIAVLNRRHALVAGYCFERARFPWVAVWEENRARQYPPWNGVARVRGVEFGTSPMPLGIEQARETQRLFDTPVLTRIAPDSEVSTAYDIFVTRVPASWKAIAGIERSTKSLAIRNATGEKVRLLASDKFR
jgi:Domain of unknown function (DUF4432)